MSTLVRSASNHPAEVDTLLVAEPVTMPLVVLRELPAAPSGALTCGQRLPRDVLVRLTALSRQVGYLRQAQVGHPELSLRLEKVAAGLDALIQSIYDETALHLAGRRA